MHFIVWTSLRSKLAAWIVPKDLALRWILSEPSTLASTNLPNCNPWTSHIRGRRYKSGATNALGKPRKTSHSQRSKSKRATVKENDFIVECLILLDQTVAKVYENDTRDTVFTQHHRQSDTFQCSTNEPTGKQ